MVVNIFVKTVSCLFTSPLIVFHGTLINKSLSSWKLFRLIFCIHSVFLFPLSTLRSSIHVEGCRYSRSGCQFLLSLYSEPVFPIPFIKWPLLPTLLHPPRYYGGVFRDDSSSVKCAEAFSMDFSSIF